MGSAHPNGRAEATLGTSASQRQPSPIHQLSTFPPLPPTDWVRAARALLLLPAAQATTTQPLGRLGSVTHTHTPRTHRCKGFRPQGQGGDFPKQLETDPPRDSGCITAAGLFQGPWTTYSFGPARGWGVPPHQHLSCLCLFPTGLLGASVSSAWPQPPNLSSRLSMQSQQICCHGRWQNSRAARGHQEGCAEPQARGVLWEGGHTPSVLPSEGGWVEKR